METCPTVAKRLVPTSEAADYIGISTQTLARWVREGWLRPSLTTKGGHYRWDLDDLAEQVQRHAQDEQADEG